MKNNELVCYAKLYVLKLEYKKSISNNETKVNIDSIIASINNEVIPDILKIKSKNYIIEYGEIIQDFALKNGITLPSFITKEWKPIYRELVINDLIQ